MKEREFQLDPILLSSSNSLLAWVRQVAQQARLNTANTRGKRYLETTSIRLLRSRGRRHLAPPRPRGFLSLSRLSCQCRQPGSSSKGFCEAKHDKLVSYPTLGFVFVLNDSTNQIYKSCCFLLCCCCWWLIMIISEEIRSVKELQFRHIKVRFVSQVTDCSPSEYSS